MQNIRLLRRLEACCRDSGMAETRFAREHFNDPRIPGDLRNSSLGDKRQARLDVILKDQGY